MQGMPPEEAVRDLKDEPCCFAKRKSAKILEAFVLALCMVFVLALFSVPVAFVIVEVSLHAKRARAWVVRRRVLRMQCARAVTWSHSRSQVRRDRTPRVRSRCQSPIRGDGVVFRPSLIEKKVI